jgi:hypothetical protein
MATLVEKARIISAKSEPVPRVNTQDSFSIDLVRKDWTSSKGDPFPLVDTISGHRLLYKLTSFILKECDRQEREAFIAHVCAECTDKEKSTGLETLAKLQNKVVVDKEPELQEGKAAVQREMERLANLEANLGWIIGQPTLSMPTRNFLIALAYQSRIFDWTDHKWKFNISLPDLYQDSGFKHRSWEQKLKVFKAYQVVVFEETDDKNVISGYIQREDPPGLPIEIKDF